MFALENCSDRLSRVAPDGTLDDAEKQQLSERLHELRISLENPEAELDSELRAFLLRHVHAMEYAIAMHPYRGAEALREAAQMALGQMMVRRDLYARMKDSMEGLRFVRLAFHAASIAMGFGADLTTVLDGSLWPALSGEVAGATDATDVVDGIISEVTEIAESENEPE